MRLTFKPALVMGFILLLVLLLPATQLVSQDQPAGTPPAFATQSAQLNDALNLVGTLQAENEALREALTSVAPSFALPTATPSVRIPSDRELEYETVTTADFEIDVPVAFEGGDVQTDLKLILSTMRMLGSNFSGMANLLEQNPQLFKLFSYDTEMTDGIITNLNVVIEDTLLDLTLPDYVERGKRLLPPELTVVSQDQIHPGDYDVALMISEWEIVPGVLIKQAQYVMKFDRRYVTLTFTTSKTGFDAWLPDFEMMAASFKWLGD